MTNTLLGILDDAVANQGDKMAIKIPNSEVSLSYKELYDCIFKIQVQLVEEGGLQPQDTLAIVAPNGLAFLCVFLGCTTARAKVSPLNPAYGVSEFSFYLKDTEAKAVIILKEWKEHLVRKSAEELNIPVWEIEQEGNKVSLLIPTNQDNNNTSNQLTSIIKPNENDTALFLHTSGTTSTPKGVPLTHLNIYTSITNISNTYELTSNDISYIVMPLFHVHGLIGATLSTFRSGGCVVVPEKFSATNFWNDVIENHVTWYSAVPTIHQILLIRHEDHPIPSNTNIRFIRSCSSSLAPSTLQKLEEITNSPVLEAYGMTEASHQMSSNPLPKNGDRKCGSVGKGTNVEISIMDDNGNPLQTTEKGEVCIRGKNVTLGYHNRPDANAENFLPGGWFRTGDQGFLDSDGYLTLTGRIKELINRGGEKISPIELDSILLEHPGVQSAVSFSVPDEKYGEEVNAAVVCKSLFVFFLFIVLLFIYYVY